MKAKSWKKYAKKSAGSDANGKDTLSKVFDTARDRGSSSASPSFESIIEGNGRLKGLMAEREALEKQMAELTGQASSDRLNRFAEGEIPSHAEKRRRDEEWEEKRRQALIAQRERIGAIKEPVFGGDKKSGKKKNSSVPKSYNDVAPEVNDKRFLNKIKQEKDRWSTGLDRVERKVDGLMEKKKKAEEALGIKSLKENNVLEQKWDQLKEKRLEIKSLQSKYEKKIARILDVDTGSLEKLAQKNDKLKERSMEKKREEKKEEEKREKKREERKQKKKERF